MKIGSRREVIETRLTTRITRQDALWLNPAANAASDRIASSQHQNIQRHRAIPPSMANLDTLPPEILFTVLSYTEPNLNPTLPTYPLNTLAATNKHLNAIVEEYARNLLKRHADIILPKKTRIYTCRRKWLGDLCYFCKKKTQRKACLYKTIACCLACDKKEYEKMVCTPRGLETLLYVYTVMLIYRPDNDTSHAIHPTLQARPVYPVAITPRSPSFGNSTIPHHGRCMHYAIRPRCSRPRRTHAIPAR